MTQLAVKLQVGGKSSWHPPSDFPTIQHGIKIGFHWIDAGEGEEQTLVLISASGGRAARAIPLSQIAHWFKGEDRVDAYIQPSEYGIQQSVQTAHLLGMEPNMKSANKVFDIVYNCLPLLKDMPPNPMMGKRELGDVKMYQDGKLIHHTGVNI